MTRNTNISIAGRIVRSGTGAVAPLYPAALVQTPGAAPALPAPAPHAPNAPNEAAFAAIAAMLAEGRRQLEAARTRLESQLPSAALALARRILDAEFAARPERIIDLARTGVRAAGGAERLEVRVHPAQLALLRGAIAALARDAPNAAEVRVEPDPTLPPHGLRIETDMGTYFAGLEDRLRRLETRVLDPLAREGGES